MYSNFLVALATIREEDNGVSKANSDQKSDESEAAANKAFLEKNLKSKSDSESDTFPDDKSKSNKNEGNESKNDKSENNKSKDNENNFTAILLQLFQKSKFANYSTSWAKKSWFGFWIEMLLFQNNNRK